MKSWCPTRGTIFRLLGHKSVDFIKEFNPLMNSQRRAGYQEVGHLESPGKLLKVVFYPWPDSSSSFFDSLSNSWFPMSLVALLQQTIALRHTSITMCGLSPCFLVLLWAQNLSTHSSFLPALQMVLCQRQACTKAAYCLSSHPASELELSTDTA